MEIHKIAVLSDTHGLLRPEVTKLAQSCEIILHAGDFDNQKVLEALKAVAPVYAVRGNNDRGWAANLGKELEITLFGLRIYMVHNRKRITGKLSGVDIVVCGHTHQYEERREDGVLYLNPGSCGPKRFRLPITMMVATLYPAEHRIETERVEWGGFVTAAGKSTGEREWAAQEHGDPGPEMGEAVLEEQSAGRRNFASDRDMYKLIKRIMKEVRAGKTIEEIAAGNRVEKELAEQICRFYVTHPGVDVDGILNRMELHARSK